jgi:hypothetical protein
MTPLAFSAQYQQRPIPLEGNFIKREWLRYFKGDIPRQSGDYLLISWDTAMKSRFTANIGVHHVQHLCSRIPYYRLPQVLRDHPKLRGVSRLTLLQSFRCVRLVLWDETRRWLVSFREGRTA